ncbi:hypothetical protein DFH06DRAFT_1348471 [Mycena polygramma]|nr:hypothetical protein DFH06DRAFT_1348471 [Mycena polygramma]
MDRRSGFHPYANPVPIKDVEGDAGPKEPTVTEEDILKVQKWLQFCKVVSVTEKKTEDEEREAFLAEAEDFLANMQATRSPVCEAARKCHEVLWTMFVRFLKPNLSKENVWYLATVKECTPKYILWVFKKTSPRIGKKTLKASTIAYWNKRLVENIARFTWDPVNERKAGMGALTYGGLFHELHEIIINVINNFKLDRNQDEKLFYDRMHIQLVIEEILAAGYHAQRAGIQTITRTLFTMYGTLWPSSLGPRTEFLRTLDRGTLNTVQASEQFLKLQSVLNSSNILFDPTLWILELLLLRGALLHHKYGKQLGERVSQDLLNHTKEGVFHSYSKGVWNVDLVQLCLGEVAGTNEEKAGDILKDAIGSDGFLSFAVEAIVRKQKRQQSDHIPTWSEHEAEKKRQASSTPSLSMDQLKEANQAAEADPELKKARKALSIAFECFHSFFVWDASVGKLNGIALSRRTVATRYGETVAGLKQVVDAAKSPHQQICYRGNWSADDPKSLDEAVATCRKALRRPRNMYRHTSCIFAILGITNATEDTRMHP